MRVSKGCLGLLTICTLKQYDVPQLQTRNRRLQEPDTAQDPESYIIPS